MHSRIFQISKNPIHRDDYITENYYDYDHWFLKEVADYVATQEGEERKISLEWLGKRNGIDVNINSSTIVVTSKDEYFKDKYKEFKSLLIKLQNLTLDDFKADNHDVESNILWLNWSYADKFGFYVEDCGEWAGLFSLDEWVRHAKENTTYYIGGVCDYHS